MELQVRKNVNVSLKLLDPRSLDQNYKSHVTILRQNHKNRLNYGLNESKIQFWMIRFIKPGTGEVLIALLDDFVDGFVRM